MCDSDYLKKQIITYMGNKRKLLHHIESALIEIQESMPNKALVLGDGFSGSGIVSRLFKKHGSKVYSNDNAGYSKTLSDCFLSNVTNKDVEKIEKYVAMANKYVNSDEDVGPHYIRVHWSPSSSTNVKKGERAYFTHENGARIDKYCYYIREKIPKKYQCYLMAILLVECSIRNNTNGQFSAFYKKGNIGHFGGKNETDLHRITKPIVLTPPVLCTNSCSSVVDCLDVFDWINLMKQREEKMDVVYYDPPYNKHPYNIYYFLLDIINAYDVTLDIPDTLRGQPKNWIRSPFNSSVHAKDAFERMITNTNSKYILVSYNNDGLISLQDMENILKKKGKVSCVDIEHKTYNRLKGLASYKREGENKKIKEVLWVVECV